MPLVDSTGRLFGKINVIDGVVLGVLFCAALGIVGVQSGWHQTSGQVVQGQTDIEYTFLMHNAKTLRPDLFKPGKKLSMTIRKQPRGEVLITDVKVSPKQAIIQNPSAGGYKLVDDPADPYGYEYLVTVRDHATKTVDGYVTEGVKVKIGLAVDIEGFDYAFPAVIVDVHEASGKTAATARPALSDQSGV